MITRKALTKAARLVRNWALGMVVAYYVVTPILLWHRPDRPIYSPEWLAVVTLGWVSAEIGRWLWRKHRRARIGTR